MNIMVCPRCEERDMLYPPWLPQAHPCKVCFGAGLILVLPPKGAATAPPPEPEPPIIVVKPWQ